MRLTTRLLWSPSFRALLVLTAVLLTASGVRAQVCDRDFWFQSQAEVDIFACTEVTGDVRVGPSSDIENLDALAGLTTIGGWLAIEENAALTNIDGLSDLFEVGTGIWIEENASLTNIDGLAGLPGAVDPHSISAATPHSKASMAYTGRPTSVGDSPS